MDEGGLDDRLRPAVRAGDAEAVRDLLDKGADPNALDADGLPVLRVAVAAYDDAVAGVLVEGGDRTAVIRWNGATGRHYRAADPNSPGKDVPLYTV
ncbi:hypothetical protein [Streptomyces chartreusis]|uniref:hypothetical protein n=1 Tax=Streptomyces chartreusis TaxID=1969 RepID=UPI00362D46C1